MSERRVSERASSKPASSEPASSESASSEPASRYFLMHFCPGTMAAHAEPINSDLQRGLGRRLRYTQH